MAGDMSGILFFIFASCHPLSIDGDDIERVSTFKYLGTWIDPLLKWDDHVLNTCEKISQRIGLVSRLRGYNWMLLAHRP